MWLPRTATAPIVVHPAATASSAATLSFKPIVVVVASVSATNVSCVEWQRRTTFPCLLYIGSYFVEILSMLDEVATDKRIAFIGKFIAIRYMDGFTFNIEMHFSSGLGFSGKWAATLPDFIHGLVF